MGALTWGWLSGLVLAGVLLGVMLGWRAAEYMSEALLADRRRV